MLPNLKHTLRVVLSLVAGASVTFFIFGISHASDSGITSRILTGFLWVVFGFAKRGFVNTSKSGQLVYYNLWPFIVLVSAIIWAFSFWRSTSKSHSRA